MSRRFLLWCSWCLLGAAACNTGEPSAPAPATETRRVAEPPLRTRNHAPGPPAYLNAGDACPAPPLTPLAIPTTDKWGGLITLRDASDTLYMAPLHASVTIDGELIMFGFTRTTGDFSLSTFDIAPTFVMKPDVYTDADVEVRTDIYGAPFEKVDSWFCGGHTFLADGRPVVVGGTRTATNAVKPGLPQDKRGWGLTYGAIFGEQGWVRIPRDFIGGEAWYPTLIRLSDGRLLMYSGYFELDANLPEIKATLDFNRTIQIFDSRETVEPWTIVSPSGSTPRGTEPTNYTWMYELPVPINAGGADRQIFMMGSEGKTFLMNHVSSFADPAQRFVERTRRTNTADLSPDANIVALLPYFHEQEKLRYRPGSVVAIGGDTDPKSKAVDIYDPYIDKWCELTRPLGITRKNSAYTYLPDGNLLVINGEPVPFPPASPAAQNTPQIIDPRTGEIAEGKPEPLASARGYHNVALLVPDGRVFVGAGRSAVFNDVFLPDERTDGRFYSPYYLGILPPSDRPQIVGIPKDPVMHFKGEYTVDYKNGEITGAALVGLPAMTHATDFNARYVELEVRAGGTDPRGKVTVSAPDSGLIAPPGPYMLFLLRKVKGVNVPSVAQIIRVDGPSPTCEGSPTNACGGCRTLLNFPGAACHDVCGPGTFKCDGPNKTSCNACL